MMHTLEQLAKLTNSSFDGDKDIQINSVATLKDAKSGQISFLSNPKYIDQLETTSASAVIVNTKAAKEYNGNALINDDPYLTFAKVLQILHSEPKPAAAIHKTAIIDENVSLDKTANIGANVIIESDVTIDKDVVIGAGCFIGKGSRISSGTHLYPNVTIYKDTIIGKNTIIHSGVIIGADGFGFAPTAEKEWFKIQQSGNVSIGDDVEIGANTTIDRAALGTTEIHKGVKLDNHMQIGHNSIVGENTIMAASTVIAGSVVIGKRCQIGGASAINGHISIADDVVLTGRSMVMKSIKAAGAYSSGIPSDENRKWRRNAARFRKLDEMAKTVIQLEKKLNEK